MKSLIIAVVLLLSVFNVNSATLKTKESAITSDNNPPTNFKLYASIPVAVVYEDGNRKDKALESESQNINNTVGLEVTTQNDLKFVTESNYTVGLEETTQNELNIVTESNQSEITEENKADNQDTTGSKTQVTSTEATKNPILIDTADKWPIKSELHIPVVVIYDEPPEKGELQSTTTSPVIKKRQRKLNSNSANKISSVKSDKGHKTVSNGRNSSSNITSSKNKTTRERAAVVPILQSENYVFAHQGEFHYSYESGDGTKAFERGGLTSNSENAGESVMGSFSFKGKDGNDYSLTYTADENGYRPVGDHLPTPPPIPPAIARALKYLATKVTPEPVTEPNHRGDNF